ncbi:hypothetical protein GQ54DRAFT_65915 [Martensiomyces pterosporus]|nr:hypothetical protein GQ54DRAFT_65915 [Martensiomyces pterosporus]
MAGNESLAQCMPVLALERIVFYTTGHERRSGFKGNSNSALLKGLAPLLGVCRNWRSVAAPLFYQDIDLCISHHTSGCRRHTVGGLFASHSQRLARYANVFVPCYHIIDG